MKAKVVFFWVLLSSVVASQNSPKKDSEAKVPIPVGKVGETEDLTIWTLDGKFVLLDLTPTGRYASIFGLSACLMIAITAKCSIFKTIFTLGIKSKPVNLLIFLDQLCNTVHRSLSIFVSICSFLSIFEKYS